MILTYVMLTLSCTRVFCAFLAQFLYAFYTAVLINCAKTAQNFIKKKSKFFFVPFRHKKWTNIYRNESNLLENLFFL